jgi:acetylornithine deacetylase/succinyl-diaminopimelate desuccinylase-like protein
MQYVDKLENEIGSPDLLVCLDSGTRDYERLWITTSLRGVVNKDIEIACFEQAIHSGLGSGHGKDSFDVAREIFDRISDSKTGKVVDELQVQIPQSKLIESKGVTDILGKEFILVKNLEGVQYLSEDLTELYLNGTWRATLTVVGQSGLPLHSLAGNVLRDKTTFRISVRLPPTKDPNEASDILDKIILSNPPHGAKIKILKSSPGSGWAAKDFCDKLNQSLSKSSNELWGKNPQTFGEGGSIPFLNSLAQKFPKGEFLVLGVLGPGSNAHAANETLNIPYCKKVTTTLIHAVHDLFN